ncbi:MAG: hypothetical protein ABSF73_07785, partial [Terriglobia bacterium]
RPDYPPRLGWKAEPSSRAEGKKGGCLRRKARGFPHSRRQSRFFRDFDATLMDCGVPVRV